MSSLDARTVVRTLASTRQGHSTAPIHLLYPSLAMRCRPVPRAGEMRALSCMWLDDVGIFPFAECKKKK